MAARQWLDDNTSDGAWRSCTKKGTAKQHENTVVVVERDPIATTTTNRQPVAEAMTKCLDPAREKNSVAVG